MPALKNELHHFWKGDAASYSSVHNWVRRRLGTATKCEDCGSENRVEWANLSHNYTRDESNLEDWKALCKPCHIKYDRPYWGDAKRLFDARKLAGVA